MKSNTILTLACMLMFLGISLGAFGAHAWQNVLTEHQTEKSLQQLLNIISFMHWLYYGLVCTQSPVTKN